MSRKKGNQIYSMFYRNVYLFAVDFDAEHEKV